MERRRWFESLVIVTLKCTFFQYNIVYKINVNYMTILLLVEGVVVIVVVDCVNK